MRKILLFLFICLLIVNVFPAEEEVGTEFRVKVFVEEIDHQNLRANLIFENIPGNSPIISCFYAKSLSEEETEIQPDVEELTVVYSEKGIYSVKYRCLSEIGEEKSAQSAEFIIGTEEVLIEEEIEDETESDDYVNVEIKVKDDDEVIENLLEDLGDDFKLDKINQENNTFSGEINKDGLDKLKKNENVLAVLKGNRKINYLGIITSVVVFGAIIIYQLFFRRK